MSDFLDRLRLEKSELDEKIDKLESFVKSDKLANVDEVQQALLPVQLNAMKTYSEILARRLHYLEV